MTRVVNKHRNIALGLFQGCIWWPCFILDSKRMPDVLSSMKIPKEILKDACASSNSYLVYWLSKKTFSLLSEMEVKEWSSETTFHKNEYGTAAEWEKSVKEAEKLFELRQVRRVPVGLTKSDLNNKMDPCASKKQKRKTNQAPAATKPSASKKLRSGATILNVGFMSSLVDPVSALKEKPTINNLVSLLEYGAAVADADADADAKKRSVAKTLLGLHRACNKRKRQQEDDEAATSNEASGDKAATNDKSAIIKELPASKKQRSCTNNIIGPGDLSASMDILVSAISMHHVGIKQRESNFAPTTSMSSPASSFGTLEKSSASRKKTRAKVSIKLLRKN